jgi:hypothetical protein
MRASPPELIPERRSVGSVGDVPVTLGAVNVRATDVELLGDFWAALLGAERAPGSAYLPPAGPGGLAMFFQQLDGLRAGEQVTHLDLTVPWGERESVAARAVALGARHQWDVLTEHTHVRWTTLTDPEGNLFCIAEHPPAAA